MSEQEREELHQQAKKELNDAKIDPDFVTEALVGIKENEIIGRKLG